jgi:nucleoside-diphosphate-sugar epimerase
MMSSTITVVDEAARRDLGYRPVVSFDDGVRALASAA